MKKIEEIEVGDIVWSHNSENGKKELKEVTELFRFNKNSTITLKINGEEIVTTDLHLFYTLEKSWTSAKDLELGDTVVTLSGEKYKIEAIDKDYYDGIIVVYNFEVEDNHNYYVGDNQVLVHNDGCTVSDKGSSGDRVYDSSKPLSSSNYPNPDPSFVEPPVRYEPKTIEEVVRMRQGKGPTTRATHGDTNIEAHHRGQKSMSNGGIMDEIQEYVHRRGGNHTRHQLPSELTPAQRAAEIRAFYKKRGSEYILPGEGI